MYLWQTCLSCKIFQKVIKVLLPVSLQGQMWQSVGFWFRFPAFAGLFERGSKESDQHFHFIPVRACTAHLSSLGHSSQLLEVFFSSGGSMMDMWEVRNLSHPAAVVGEQTHSESTRREKLDGGVTSSLNPRHCQNVCNVVFSESKSESYPRVTSKCRR